MNKRRRNEMERAISRIRSLYAKHQADKESVTLDDLKTAMENLRDVAEEERGVLECYPDNLQGSSKWMDDDDICSCMEQALEHLDDHEDGKDSLEKLFEKIIDEIDNI